MGHTLKDLQMLQGLPLNEKIEMTQERIKAWVDHYGEDKVYMSFSGGKDSTVLLDIVRKLYPNVPAVFVNTGLEFPEIVDFVKSFDNVEIVKPKMNFVEVIRKYGYPMISKEVSECVQGARKYLTSLLNDGTLDRQTDRQTDLIGNSTVNYAEQANIAEIEHMKSIRGGYKHLYNYECDRLFGTCRQASNNAEYKGGYDRKYRRLRGIGEFIEQAHESENGRCKPKASNHVRNVDKFPDDTGEYP